MGTRSTGEGSPRSSAAASRDSSPRTEQCLYLLEKIKKHISYWPQFVSNDEMMRVQSRDDNEYSTTRISLDHAHHQLNFLIKNYFIICDKRQAALETTNFAVFYLYFLFFIFWYCIWIICVAHESMNCVLYFLCSDGHHLSGSEDFYRYWTYANYFAHIFLAASYIIKMGENTTRMMQNN